GARGGGGGAGAPDPRPPRASLAAASPRKAAGAGGTGGGRGGAPAARPRVARVPNPKSVTKFGGVSTTLAALLLLGIAPTIPRRRALPASPNRPRLWQRTSDPGH